MVLHAVRKQLEPVFVGTSGLGAMPATPDVNLEPTRQALSPHGGPVHGDLKSPDT